MTRVLEGQQVAPLLQRIDRVETPACKLLSELGGRWPLLPLFQIISRLGNGVFWYGLIAAIALTVPETGASVALRMALAGLAGFWIYRRLKGHIARERPYVASDTVSCRAAALDRYSFPSGHTLHAVSFTLIACHYLPELTWALVPFAALVAVSRVLLGLHYPSDVLAGGLIGYGVAAMVICIPG